MLLAIETSCDETALALFEKGCLKPIAEKIASQVDLHEAYGGVVPELAARQHLQALPILWRSILDEAGVTSKDLEAIAVTVGPGLQGCLLVGVSFAKAFAQANEIPLIPVHHIEGHIAAASLIEDFEPLQYPALALIVSGGHTMIVELLEFRTYRLLAETRDDAAGEAFDKIASILELPYPGGPSLSKLAESGNPEAYSFPIALPRDLASFSFSGLKTAVNRMVSSLSVEELQIARADVAASAQRAIVQALVGKLFANLDEKKHQGIIITGGVAANRDLRLQAQECATKIGVKLYVPPIKYCTDNAAMIGVVAQEILSRSASDFEKWDPALSLGPTAEFDLGARARWPFSELVT